MATPFLTLPCTPFAAGAYRERRWVEDPCLVCWDCTGMAQHWEFYIVCSGGPLGVAIGPPTETIGPQVQWSRSGGGLGGTPGLGCAGDFFEDGKIGAILGGGPPPLFPLLFPFSPTFSLSSFPLSLTPGLHSTNAFKNLVLFALQCRH